MKLKDVPVGTSVRRFTNSEPWQVVHHGINGCEVRHRDAMTWIPYDDDVDTWQVVPPPIPERWGNYYGHGMTAWYSTRNVADAMDSTGGNQRLLLLHIKPDGTVESFLPDTEKENT